MPNAATTGGVSRALAARGVATRPNRSSADSQGMAFARKRSCNSRNGVATKEVDARLTSPGIPRLGDSLEFRSRSLPCSGLGGAQLVKIKGHRRYSRLES